MIAKIATALALQAIKSKVKSSGKGSGHPAPTEDKSALEKLWTAQAAWDMAEKLYDLADRQFPTFNHTISVSVKGGPEADLRRIWYLCVSAAFGRYRNRSIGVQKAIFDATWDVTGKSVSCTIGYSDSGLISGTTRALGDGSVPDSGLMLIQRGPDQVTIGGNWPGFLWTVGQSLSSVIPAVIGGALPQIPGLNYALSAAISTAALFIPGNGAGLVQFFKGLLSGTLEPPFSIASSTNSWQLTRKCTENWDYISMLQSNWGTVDVLKEMPRRGVGNSLALPWRRVYPVTLGANSRYGSNLSITSGFVPVLPDDGRIITTGEKGDARVQPPKPALDGISRNSLVQLVAQTAMDPCFIPKPVPCMPQIGREGLRLYEAGTGDSNVAVNATQITRVIQPGSFGPVSSFAFMTNRTVGPDGYPYPPFSVLQVSR